MHELSFSTQSSIVSPSMAAGKFILIFSLLLSLSKFATSQPNEFFFSGFNNTTAKNNLTLNGDAEIDQKGLLQLTNSSIQQIGHAFHSSLVQLKNSSDGKAFSFSTAFAFSILPQYINSGGHGFAFAISPSKDLAGALPSQFLGLLNSTDVGNFSNRFFAVEFDTAQDIEFDDIDDNHIGVDINSLVSSKSVSVSDINLKSGEVIQAWIDYNSMNNLIEVRISKSSIKPRTSILSFNVDLSTIVDDFMYVGFSASTGLLTSSHYILGWSFNMNGEAKSLYLEALPSISQPKSNNHKKGLIIGISIGSGLALCLIIGLSFYIYRKIKNRDEIEPWEINIGPHRFSYKELKGATRGFGEKEVIGFGGFGRVYKGTLLNSNTQIAVKRIFHESKQGLQEFVSEISSIGRLRHRNLVQLLGWCRKKDDLLLVYEFLPNGSLDRHLFDKYKQILTWGQRFNIIKGVASGLLYLHEEWEQTVIHRDIKAGNVLLDSELNAKLGDFGLAKLHDHGSNPSTTRVVGTLGYLAPELTRTGKPTTSSDVFAFGALLLEVVCGRRPVEPKARAEEEMLVDWVWEKWREREIFDVVDPRLGGEFDEAEVVVVIKLGLMCSSNRPGDRPNMRQVVRFLEGEAVLPDLVAIELGGLKNGGFGGYYGESESYISLNPDVLVEKKNTLSSVRSDDVDVEFAGLASSVELNGRGDDG